MADEKKKKQRTTYYTLVTVSLALVAVGSSLDGPIAYAFIGLAIVLALAGIVLGLQIRR